MHSPTPVHIIGASGRSGLALARAALAGGWEIVPVVRDRAKWEAAGLALPPRVADVADAVGLRAALHDARVVVSTAHARHTQAVLDAAPRNARFVLLGSTRKLTRWPDAHGSGVLAGERAFMASGRSGVMLHPTMIYGAQGENNVRRLAALVARLPILPLPGGGAALVQPIHQADVTRGLLVAIGRTWEGPHALVIAGRDAVPYAEFVRAVARAAGLRAPRIVPFPLAPLIAVAPMTRVLPFVPSIGPDEIRRLTEDKAFDIGPMRAELGFAPIGLEEGLARTFGRTEKNA